MSARLRSRITVAWILAFGLVACQGATAPSVPIESTAAPAATEPAPAATTAAVPFAQSALAALQELDSDRLTLAPVHPATGRALQGYEPIDLGANFHYDFTSDRSSLILARYPSAEGSFAELHFLDLPTWTEATGLQLPTRGWTSAHAVSADGNRFAIATVETRRSTVWLVDAAACILLKHIDTPLYVAGMDFSSDSERLMIYGQQERVDTGLSQGPPIAELRSAQDLGLLWSRTLESVRDGFEPNDQFKGEAHEPGAGTTYRPGIAFAPISDSLYLVHADAQRLTGVDFARKRVLTLDIQPRLSWFEGFLALGAGTAHAKVQDGTERRAIVSPDGEIIYTLGLQNKFTKPSNGDWELTQTALQLQAIRSLDAAELYRSEAAGESLSPSGDSHTILVHRWDYAAGGPGATIEVNAVNGAILREAAGLDLRPTRRMDGSPLLVSAAPRGGQGATTMSAFAPDGTPLGSWETPRYGDWLLVP
ncbi:MAG: hypothetical protein V1755_01695 [Chloroflexota bacterium]